jgi:eukaryotic-like serine/threonine-protein kinase
MMSVWTIVTTRCRVVFDDEGWLGVNGLQPIGITRQAAAFLRTLLLARGGTVTWEQMGLAVWRRPDVGGATRDKAKHRLHQLLPKDQDVIITLKGRGWCLNRAAQVNFRPVRAPDEPSIELLENLPVPHSEGFILVMRLGQSPGMQTWLAVRDVSPLQRIYRLAMDEVRRVSIAAELASYRRLELAYGGGRAAPRICRARLEEPPYSLEIEVWGAGLRDWAAEDNRLARMSEYEVVELWLSIAAALQRGHAIGVCHQNLKPSNVLVRGFGRQAQVMLTDWGSSRVFYGCYLKSWVPDPQLDLPCIVAPAAAPYSAPELLHDPEQPGTQKSDVYALGVLLVQLLTRDFRRTLGHGFERGVPERLREPLLLAAQENPAQRIGLDALIAGVRRAQGGPGLVQGLQERRS